jgi:cob(I)alamin adenosyltransferase
MFEHSKTILSQMTSGVFAHRLATAEMADRIFVLENGKIIEQRELTNQRRISMPRLTKIYTRTGDDGTTSLGSNQRVSKDSLRIAANGCIDELNSWLGLTLSLGICDRLKPEISKIQNELFHLGADLSIPDEDKPRFPVPKIEEHHITHLEGLIAEITSVVGPLNNFILPSGKPVASLLHIARTVCRRTEREVVRLAKEEKVNPATLQYLNRLSDALFVMARYENHQSNVAETLWDSRA